MMHSGDLTNKNRAETQRHDNAKPTSSLSSSNEPSAVYVFISYAHNDAIIAQALYEELIDVNSTRVNCFLDTKIIQSGRNFEDELTIALKQADWLVCIYTGEPSEYCGYEIGIFKTTRSIPSGVKDDRLVCLHDVENPPGVFRNHQNSVITFPPAAKTASSFDENSFYLNSSISTFFKNFYKYKGLYVPKDADEGQRQITKLVRQSKRITEAFKAARTTDVLADTPTQLLIDVSVSAKAGERMTEVPDESEITGTFQSLGLFGLMPHMVNRQLPITTWGRLKEVLAQKVGGRSPFWIESLDRIW